MRYTVIFLFGILAVDTCFSFGKTTGGQAIQRKIDAMKYLDAYGYNPCTNSTKTIGCTADYSSMLREFQKRHKLEATGNLDAMTVRQMKRPHCGNQNFRASSMNREKWHESSLTWSLRSHPTQFSREKTVSIIRQAFNIWLTQIPLTITETCTTCHADIIIETSARDHHCSFGSFDGPGGVLAHASFPVDGRIHFDADESWTAEFDKHGFNFFIVAVHEIGHALGLDHVDQEGSIMHPVYQLWPHHTILSENDRQRIQELYGNRTDDENDDSDDTNNRTIHWGSDDWAHGCYFEENDIRIILVSAEKCGPACESNPNCTHFTWDEINGGTCWLKGGPISKNDARQHHDHTTICGVVKPESERRDDDIDWGSNDWANGCEFIGNDLTSVRVPAEECGPECDSNPGCTHFTWTKHAGGTCWMKGGRISKKDAIPKRDQSMVCGVASSSEELHEL